MDKLGLLLVAAYCAIQAIRTTNLLLSVLWLASVSALTTIILFTLDAPQAAVIEISVGAGLVAVLLVFAISIAGEETLHNHDTLWKKMLRRFPLITVLFLLLWILLPLPETQPGAKDTATFSTILWEDRALDVLLQIVIIFSAVLSLLGLLADQKLPAAVQHYAAPHPLNEAASPTEQVAIVDDEPILEPERELA
ncbi:MAG: NADH-quinone oxidoreductase subunit J [Anaerolineae bacterium]|nr:NADH-quinone oxidoreductase subunit J [Anaerolineae bacterium]